VLTLGLCNHTTQENGSCDHQEYGTVHAVIYNDARGCDKSLMELTEVLHPTYAPLMLQVPEQMLIKNRK
jgi:hypothetical protein